VRMADLAYGDRVLARDHQGRLVFREVGSYSSLGSGHSNAVPMNDEYSCETIVARPRRYTCLVIALLKILAPTSISGQLLGQYYYCYTGLHSRLGCWPGNQTRSLMDEIQN
jgi:hypothetical protein